MVTRLGKAVVVDLVEAGFGGDEDLHPDQGLDPVVLGGLVEGDGAEEVSAVGQGDGGRALSLEGGHQRLETHRAFEQAELRVEVKVDVSGASHGRMIFNGNGGLSMKAPKTNEAGRASTPGVPPGLGTEQHTSTPHPAASTKAKGLDMKIEFWEGHTARHNLNRQRKHVHPRGPNGPRGRQQRRIHHGVHRVHRGSQSN
jgi:hypothetical protein